MEIAGFAISGVSLLIYLVDRYKDLSKWPETDLLVDRDWLPLALSRGVLEGREDDYVWSREDKVATLELRGTASVVVPYNEEKKMKYRIRRGDRLILMRKTPAAAAA